MQVKVRLYAARLVDLNFYLDLFPGENISDKICGMELNEILLNSMPNSWSKQAYVQVFYCEYITLNQLLKCLNSWKYNNLFMKV